MPNFLRTTSARLPSLALASLLTAMSLTGCAKPTVVVSSGPELLVQYSKAFQSQAADELEAMKPSCQTNSPSPDCSVVRSMIGDYVKLRDQLRK